MHCCCFPKSSRLRKPSEFKTVYQQNSIRVKGRYFTVLTFCRFEHARLGVVVSKKVSKRAVIRNRIKRLVRENYRQRDSQPALDYVVIAKAGVDEQKGQQVFAELDYLWAKINNKYESACEKY